MTRWSRETRGQNKCDGISHIPHVIHRKIKGQSQRKKRATSTFSAVIDLTFSPLPPLSFCSLPSYPEIFNMSWGEIKPSKCLNVELRRVLLLSLETMGFGSCIFLMRGTACADLIGGEEAERSSVMGTRQSRAWRTSEPDPKGFKSVDL